MRTRRSPRNQEILWRALTPPAPPVVNQPVGECCFTCVNYGGSRRNRSECTLRGVIVEGMTADRPCHSTKTPCSTIIDGHMGGDIPPHHPLVSRCRK